MTEAPKPPSPHVAPVAAHPLEILVELVRRARTAENLVALRFIAVNDSHLLAPFQQSALWSHERGIEALSGLVEVEANAPYVRWLGRVCASLAPSRPRLLGKADLPADLAEEWEQWLPAHALWIPCDGGTGSSWSGGVLFARELPWREIELRLFAEWIPTWACIYQAGSKPTLATLVGRSLRRVPRVLRRRPLLWTAALAAALLVPVHISVLAPGELVPAHPVAVRAPLDGIIKAFHVGTNEAVKQDQPLFSYEDATLTSRLDVAIEALRTAEVEERQFGQQALFDQKARGALSSAKGNVEEKRIEVEFLRQQLERNKVFAPRSGVAFVDDTNDWIGRPVVAGQRIMRLAEPDDKEIEAWLPVADAIVLPEHAEVRLYLNASPVAPVAGRLRYVSYEALRRPDGHYAYRVRATLVGKTEHRVGLKGTVRLAGRSVPLIYWMLRRPLAAAREFAGI